MGTWASLWKWWTWLRQDWDGEESKVLQRRAETRRRKRHRWPAVLETCSTHLERRPRNVLGQCCPGAAHQPAHSLHEGGTCWHDATQNARQAKIGCPCKTTDILGETGCECGIPSGTSSLPGNAERQGKCRCGFTCVPLCRHVPVREGTLGKQGWWPCYMSQGTSGEWETGKTLGES